MGSFPAELEDRIQEFSTGAFWDMPSFFARYTLHDSGLLNLSIRPAGGVVALVDWDLHWNKEIPEGHSLLAIVFRKVYSLSWREGSVPINILDGAESAKLSAGEREALLERKDFDLRVYQSGEAMPGVQDHPSFDEGLTRSVFDGISGGRAQILHGPEVALACFHESGSMIRLPLG